MNRLRGVTNILTSIGDTSGKVKPGEGDVTTGSIYVRLVDLSERNYSQFDVMADGRKIFENYPDLRVSVQGVSVWTSGGIRATDMEFNLRGPSLERLQEYADKMIRQAEAVDRKVGIQNGRTAKLEGKSAWMTGVGVTAIFMIGIIITLVVYSFQLSQDNLKKTILLELRK